MQMVSGTSAFWVSESELVLDKVCFYEGCVQVGRGVVPPSKGRSDVWTVFVLFKTSKVLLVPPLHPISS